MKRETGRVLTLREAAQLLGLSVETVRKYLQMGVLPGRRVGHEWRLSEVALHEWLAQFDSPPDVLSVAQVAELLECSENAVYHKIRRKEIPAIEIQGKLFIPREQLVLWVENQSGIAMNAMRRALGLPPREAQSNDTA
jgi:excisionase family DNA binding protein